MPIISPKPRRPQVRWSHPLARRLRAFYTFHEGSGSTLRDAVTGDIINLYGSPNWVTSPYGPALSFNGSDQYGVGTDKNWIGSIDPNSDNASNDVTALRSRSYCVIFSLNSPPATSLQSIFTYGRTDVGSRGIRVGLNSSSYFGGDGYYDPQVSGATSVVDTSQWHVGLVDVYSYWGPGSPDYWFISLDSWHDYGEWWGYTSSWDSYARHTYTEIQPEWGNGLQLARKYNGTEMFNGSIAAIIHWGDMLWAEEVTALFNDPFDVLRAPIKRFLFAAAAGPTEIAPATIATTLATHAPTITRIIAPATIGVTLATHAPSVTLGSQVVTPATVTPTLATHAPSIVLGAKIIAPSTITVTAATHAPSVTLGAKSVAPAVITTTLATHAPSMTLGAQIVSPATVTKTLATHAPSMTFGSQIVDPATIAVTAATHVPGVTGGTQTLQPTTITGTATHAPTVTRRALVVATATISAGSATHAPSILLGGQSANPTAISGAATHPPTVTRGAKSVSVGTIASGSAVRNPSVSFRAIPITPLTIFGTSLFGPDLLQGVKQIAPNSIGLDSLIFSPLVRGYQTIDPDTIPSEIGVPNPSIAFGNITVTVSSIPVTTQVNPLSIFGARRGPTLYMSVGVKIVGVPDPSRSSIESQSGVPDPHLSSVEYV